MYKINLKTIILSVIGLFFLYLNGTLFFFNATPESKRITTPIENSYSVKDPAFRTNSGIFTCRRWVDGNEAIVMSRGEDIFDAMYEDIRNAGNTISKETFVYRGEAVATTMAYELADASQRGVNVHFIMDYAGSAEATTEQLNMMKDAGVHLVRWRRPSWYQLSRFNNRTHRKLLIIDGEVAYTGGVTRLMNGCLTWKDLLEVGIEMYEYQPVMYHAKLMIVDDYFVTMGSTNFDNRSFRLNDEANVSILDEGFVLRVAERYEEDLANSERMTLEEWKNRSSFRKAYGWVITKLIGGYL